MPSYTGQLIENWESEWPYHAFIYEDALIAGHGLGYTPDEAYADAWEQFWLVPPACSVCGRFY